MMRLSGLRAVVAAAIGSQRVPHLSLTGNTFTLISDAENKKVVTKIEDDGTMYVDVHFVDANTSLSKTFYKEKYSNKEEDQVAPTCYSEDAITPSAQAQEPQCDTCAQCPHNVWGSAITDMGNKGKACRDMWKTAVVVPEFSKEALFQFRVPPASLKAWNAYVASFAEFKFPDGNEWTIGHVITRIYFEPGKQGIVNFNAIRQVNETELAYLETVQVENKAVTLIGLATGAPALPAPPKKEQKAIAQQTVVGALKKPVLKQPVPEVVEEEEELVEEVVEAVEEEEEDEEAILREMMAQRAAAKAAKAAQATKTPLTQVSAQKMPGAAKVATGQPVATKVAKIGLGAIAGGSSAKLDMTGMRVISKKKPLIQNDVEEAEVVEDQPAMRKASPIGKSSGVTGIPTANLPDDIQDMLKDIMG